MTAALLGHGCDRRLEVGAIGMRPDDLDRDRGVAARAAAGRPAEQVPAEAGHGPGHMMSLLLGRRVQDAPPVSAMWLPVAWCAGWSGLRDELQLPQHRDAVVEAELFGDQPVFDLEDADAGE